MISTLALFFATGGDTKSTAQTPETWFAQNGINIALFALVAVVIIFMFRNSRKRRRDQEELQTKFVPGVEVMTQTGIYGTLVSIDEDKNEAIIETTPGTKLRVHRQVLAKVVEPDEIISDEEEALIEEGEVVENNDSPEFGERTEEKPKRAPRKKPTE